MINALWVPPLSIPSVTRLFFWFLIGNIVFKEGYYTITLRDNHRTRNKSNDPRWRWVVYGILVMETAISYKFTKDAGNLEEDATMNPIVFYGWMIVFISCISFYSYLRWIRKTDEEGHGNHRYEKETPTKRVTRSSAKKNKKMD